ncbi:MAG: HEAT repeat domain-containing protein [Spirochaetes bacterium]|nr:HEAT repeat domain-containing protein [Spirochaetota bacterium]
MGLITPNIKRLANEEDIDGLMKCLSHKKADIRMEAFNALFLMAKTNNEILDRIRVAMSDKEPKVRIEATLKLASLGLKDIMDELKYVIVNGSKIEKIETLRVLADRYSAKDESITNLLVLALNDKTALVQIEAMKTMGLMKDPSAVFHLAEMLHDSRHAMRIEAVTALGNIGTPATIDLLIGSLMDRHPGARRAARESLKNIGTERALKAINDAPFMLLVKNMNGSVSVKIEAIRFIARQKVAEGLPLLRKACSDTYKNVRTEAIKSIGIFRDKNSINIMAQCINDPYYDVRLETVKTLEKLVLQESLLLVEKATKDYNYNVREEAKRVYYHLLDRLDKREGNVDKDE